MLSPGIISVVLMLVISAGAASKPHVMSLGKPMAVKLFLSSAEDKTVTINVRPLYLDTKLKEYTAGATHDVTDRLFVVRRAYRVNDSLPGERQVSLSGFGSAAAGCWWIALPAGLRRSSCPISIPTTLT